MMGGDGAREGWGRHVEIEAGVDGNVVGDVAQKGGGITWSGAGEMWLGCEVTCLG